jgi:protocatechuate 3,4-dioxygenase beta subunit
MKYACFLLNLLFISALSGQTAPFATEEGLDLAPDSLTGLEVEVHEIENLSGGGTEDYGLEVVTFYENEVGAYDSDSGEVEYEFYTYEKLSSDSAIIIIGESGEDQEEINITFTDINYAAGRWYEMDGAESFSGTLTFRILGEYDEHDDEQDGHEEGETDHAEYDEHDDEQDGHEEGETDHAIGSHTIIAGVYTLTDGNYIDTGRILTFDSHAECQVWSRSATADEHSDETHDHWNAAGDVFYDEINRTFTWTEYGPELDYETVEQICLDKEDGVTKTIDETNYYKDKTNLYLRIISIEENDDFEDDHEGEETVDNGQDDVEEGHEDGHDDEEEGHEDGETDHAIGSHTITAGVYTLTDGDYIDTGRILTFDSHVECQVWARSATADEHSDETHDHWNAAGDVFYDEINRTFTWTEYGPELDSETVEQLCLIKEDGVTKTIDETNYYKDKANLYLRIISIEQNDDFVDDHEGEETDDSYDGDDHSTQSNEIPVDEIEDFVLEFIADNDAIAGAIPIRAEKYLDALIGEERFVQSVELDQGISLYFDKDNQFLHASPSDEYAFLETEYMDTNEIPASILSVLDSEFTGYTVLEAEKEFSIIESANLPVFIYNVFIDIEGTEYAVNLSEGSVILYVGLDDSPDFDDEWKPVDLPVEAETYLQENFSDLVDSEISYSVDERPALDGEGDEIVVFLDDGTEIIFDEEGTFVREFNPWKDFEDNLDAGLEFDPANSSSLGDAKVHISRVADEGDDPSLLYRISIINNSDKSNSDELVIDDLDLSNLISHDSPLSLTFTYEMGPPRYFILSGSDVSGFKHTLPDLDKPGSFTIKAHPVAPVASYSHANQSVGLTYSFLVEMGGERFYEGAVFATNVIGLDVLPASYSSPWDPVAAFSLNGVMGENTSVQAFLPRRLLSGQYGILDPNDVRAALIDDSGVLSYVSGSLDEDEGDIGNLVGSNFERIPLKGFESYSHDTDFLSESPDEFEIDDSLFSENSSESNGENKSNFDFDGDGFANSLLFISFESDTFPAEIQIGDPWVDPYANLDDSSFGTITGSVKDTTGNVLNEFDVWFFKASPDLDDIYGGEPVFFDIEFGEDGTFIAKLPAGSYHAEAVAFDPLTHTPYKPQLHVDAVGEPTVFEIIDNNTIIPSISFNLEQEYRMVQEFADIQGSISVEGDEDANIDVFFDLYPVDETTGDRLTDYPVHSYGLTRSGEIKAHAPVGKFDIELFSPDNSLSLASPLDGRTIHEGLNDLGVILLNARELITVNGVITDAATNSGIWADVVFVDPENPEVQFWPMWNPPSVELAPGSYSVQIPEGSYLIKAERFDGLYQPAFYDSNNDGDADIVDVSSGISQSIDIALSSRPTATVTITLLDKNTSEPIKYAWFDFFDAEDEFAPIIFPQLDMIDFESDDFNGTYALKVPGGIYKVAVGAHAYQDVMMTIDESGQSTWLSTDWENASSVTLVDGETTDLGAISLDSFGLSEAELYGFDWMDEGAELGGSTISGSVTTSEGVAVPKARIIAHTVDYLFWFDHVQSRSDGSFEISNLPDGEWLVFAEPPFDSQSFQGYRESNQSSLSLPAEVGQDVNLVLQGSNVFGRIVYPTKNRDSGALENKGLGRAFIWVYTDEDQDGEPDWDDDIIEVFGETDKNGYFSFHLEEAGKYSFRIDLPGQLSSLSPEPIGFTLKNPSDSIKLGNAIKIDWKAEVKATAFDLERKSSTSSSYVSLFAGEDNTSSNKPTANAKSFVDSTAEPGETYSYRVIAETSNGKVTIDSDNVRTSEPFIYLAPPSKSITGRVLDGSSNPIANAEVVAWREEGEGWSSTFTDDDGSYSLTAGPGKWEITVYRPFDVKVDWVYEGAPKRVKFTKDTSKESDSKNFTVSKMAGGKIIGSIKLPDNTTYSDLSKYVSIDAFDPEGRGNWAQPDESGNFEIPLQPGQYELTLWIDPELQGFGTPPVEFVRVGKDTVDVGLISLTSRDKTVIGIVNTDSGKVLPNVHVWAWSENGGWVSDTTNINGEYSLGVSSGRWEIGYDLPLPEDGSDSPYLPTSPKRLRVKESDSSKQMNFTVREAGATVNGTVYGSNGSPISDLDAWVYAREYSEDEDEDFFEIIADAPVSSKGSFSFPGVPGKYVVGLWLSPGSLYSHPEEKIYEVDLTDGQTTLINEQGDAIDNVSFTLNANNSVVSGSFKLSGQAVTGLTGGVHAIRVDGDGWQSASIEDNGTYSLTLSTGNWALDYYIESDSLSRNFPKHPAEPFIVSAVASEVTTQDFSLASASATIAGSVLYEETNNKITDSTLFVWAYREGTQFRDEYWNEVETDENGSFSIPVLPGGVYEIGAVLSKDLRESGYLDAKVIMADLSSGSVSDLNLTIAIPSNDNFISGSILDESGNPLEEALVYAWADDGRESFAETDSSGAYKILVPNGTVWHLGGEYSIIDDSGNETFLSSKIERDIDLRNSASASDVNLSLIAPDFEIPDGNSQTFDPNIDFVTKLPDGTELTIPGGASNVSSDVDSVRIVITPTAKGLSKSANEKPANYGYSVELFDNNGKKVEGNFKKDVILSIPVDVNASKANGMNIENIEAMYYSTTKEAWDKAKTSTWDQNSSTLTMTTDHFTTFAAVSTPDVSDIASGLAKVDSENSGDWYSLDWLGYFYDATSGWIYHGKLGWLYVAEDSNGNFWFYESSIGWLWTGPTYYDETASKSFLYSSSEASWLHFEVIEGEGKFYDYSDEQWLPTK